MKIAVPVTSDNQISGHFGQRDSFGVFTISDSNVITDIRTVAPPDGCGCQSDLASSLSTDGVSILLAGGIGDGAVSKLNSEGIEVIRGCSGNATEIVKLFISGLVEDTGNSCDHHNHDHVHDHGHSCGHDQEHGHKHEHEQGHACGHDHEHGHSHAHSCGCN